MTVSLRHLARHLLPEPPTELGQRQVLSRQSGEVRVSVTATPFSLLTQNMALLPDVAYLGRNRDAATKEIISRIQVLNPDVVGLCEVFDDADKATILAGVFATHPHFRAGPDEADLDTNGGLLLLSRHPILDS